MMARGAVRPLYADIDEVSVGLKIPGQARVSRPRWCIASYPREWQPDLTLTVRWLVFKDVKTLGSKVPGVWYKAENVRIPHYDGSQSGGGGASSCPATESGSQTARS
jgi:hypothetical protein